MAEIKILYSREHDIERALTAISKIDWYIKNNYNYKNFSFPAGLDKEKLQEYSKEEISTAVDAEYSDSFYKEQENLFLEKWQIFSSQLSTVLKQCSLIEEKTYRVFLTRYGTGGGYDLPDCVNINIAITPKISLFKNLIHEIIHLAIEKQINKYKINQAIKERIVDLFLVKNFPYLSITQNAYSSINTQPVDDVFDKNFPDIESVLKNLSK